MNPLSDKKIDTQDSVLRFGLIGCGRISKVHTSVISNLSGAKLEAVCDIVKERAVEVANKFKCKVFTDYKEMINSDEIDVIDICSPTHLHSQMVIDAAKAGKHVITEKPMALSITDADNMIQECKKNNVKLFVVKQNRYNPPIVKLKEAIEEGRFGKIFYGNTTVLWHRDQSYYDDQEWFGEWEKGGGVFINQASHNIDILQWLMGEVDSVYAKIDTMTHKINAEDLGMAILRFKSGAWATIQTTTCVFPKNLEGSVSIFGERASAKVGGIQMNEMQIWEFDDYRSEDGLYHRYSTTPPNIYGFGHIKYMEDVIKTLNGEKQPFVDGAEGMMSLELILAMYKSALTGKEVKMSDFLAECRTKK